MPNSRRIQIRISQALFNKLLLEAIHCNVPFAQICRIHLNGKKITDEQSVNEND